MEQETQVRGAVIIIDFHGLSTKQVMAMSPSFAMTLLLYIQVSKTINKILVKFYYIMIDIKTQFHSDVKLKNIS